MGVLNLPAGPFGCILADPPWAFNTFSGEQLIPCRGAHSAKPDLQYDAIERLVGGPRLELFARSARPGWSAWGNEVGARDGSLFGGEAA